MRIAVLDIGGTAIKSGIYEDGLLTERKETPTEAQKGGSHVMERAQEILSSYSDYERIGISTAGQVDRIRGEIRYANTNIPGYTGMKVKELMEAHFHVPVAVENDVNAAALGEAMCGAGVDYQDFLCLTYGTGIGGAIVIDQKIYSGSAYSAGEFGAMVIHVEDRVASRDMYSGCYEKYASTTALVQRAAAYDPTLVDGRSIFARKEEPGVRALIDTWIQEIVYGLTSLVHIFNPSCILLGGGIMAQDYILDKVRRELYNNIMPTFSNVVLKKTVLGNQAGLYGAAKIALDLP